MDLRRLLSLLTLGMVRVIDALEVAIFLPKHEAT
jgi:hypothetical protein